MLGNGRRQEGLMLWCSTGHGAAVLTDTHLYRHPTYSRANVTPAHQGTKRALFLPALITIGSHGDSLTHLLDRIDVAPLPICCFFCFPEYLGIFTN